jgi:serine/threonine protein phosphatase PrpC
MPADQRWHRVEVDIGLAAGISDRGKRHHRNEDALVLRGVGMGSGEPRAAVAVVCDGVSWATRSDEASEIAAEVAAEVLVEALRCASDPAAATRSAIHTAGQAVAELAYSDGADHGAPACTFVSGVVTGGTITVGWVGDSRAYWIPWIQTGSQTEPEPPIKLTEDDSWLARVVAAGTLTADQAATDHRAHAITAWLGADTTRLDPHVITVEPGEPGVVVLCTDGLWNYLDDVATLAAALPTGALDTPMNAARRLVDIALRCGGHDNITVAVLGVGHSTASCPQGR